jgi:hypothetical protein
MDPASSPQAAPDRCPFCHAPRGGGAPRPAPARDDDEDFEYYWGDLRIPTWLGMILNVPRRQQVDILLIGFVIGLTVAALALAWGFLLSGY